MIEQPNPGTENTQNFTQQEKAQQQTMADKAAENMAGGNTFLEGLLKMLISPVTLILGGAVVFYWMSVSKKDKEQIEKLKLEVKELEDKCARLKKKKKSLEEKLEQTIRNLPETPPSYGFSNPATPAKATTLLD